MDPITKLKTEPINGMEQNMNKICMEATSLQRYEPVGMQL